MRLKKGNEIKLGDKVRSTVPGFIGAVAEVVAYPHGGPSALVTAPKPVEGEVIPEWFALTEPEVMPEG